MGHPHGEAIFPKILFDDLPGPLDDPAQDRRGQPPGFSSGSLGHGEELAFFPQSLEVPFDILPSPAQALSQLGGRCAGFPGSADPIDE